jgi:hypothetical protein
MRSCKKPVDLQRGQGAGILLAEIIEDLEPKKKVIATID